MARDIAGVELTVAKIRRAAERRKKGQIGAGPGDDRPVERRGQPIERSLARIGACAIILAIIGS